MISTAATTTMMMIIMMKIVIIYSFKVLHQLSLTFIKMYMNEKKKKKKRYAQKRICTKNVPKMAVCVWM